MSDNKKAEPEWKPLDEFLKDKSTENFPKDKFVPIEELRGISMNPCLPYLGVRSRGHENKQNNRLENLTEDERNNRLTIMFAKESVTAIEAAHYLCGYTERKHEADAYSRLNSPYKQVNDLAEILAQLPHPYDNIVGYESVMRPFLFYIEGCIEKELSIYEPIKSFAIERLKLILKRDSERYDELKESYPLLLAEVGIDTQENSVSAGNTTPPYLDESHEYYAPRACDCH